MDIWRSGIIQAPLVEVLARGGIDGLPMQWFPTPEGRYAFLADPFGLERDGRVYCFVEALDYHDRHGRIEVLVYDRDLTLLERAPCLTEPWHLSYPILLRDGDDILMLPEAHRSGATTIYRAREFPYRWERHGVVDLPFVAVDATPFRYDGRWWLFTSPAGAKEDELHLAFAERLDGPWQLHPFNPIRRGNDGSRPGGTPLAVDGKIVLPVQDCSRTYGGAVRPMTFDELTIERCSFRLGESIIAPASFAPFDAGLHTLSACGDCTLFDVKRIDRSIVGKALSLIGKARRAGRRFRRRSR